MSDRGFLSRLEGAGSDVLFRLRGFSSFNTNIVIIEITDQDLASVGRWPWDRTWHAVMTKVLKEFGAKKIYFDMIFPEASSGFGSDVAFSKAMQYAGCVYLPFAYQGRNINRATALYPTKALYDQVAGTGSINVYPDRDGIIRNLPLFFFDKENDEIVPHIALKIAMDHGNYEIDSVSPQSLILSSEQEKFTVPLIGENKVVINWLGGWKDTFAHFSYVEILANYQKSLSGLPLDIDISPIKDSICFVAVTAIGLYDIRPTPLEAEYPGVGAIATVISTLMDKKMISPSSRVIDYGLVFLLGIMPFFFVSGEKSLHEILSVVLLVTLFFFIVVKLFEKNYLINYVPAILSLIISYTGAATYHFIRVSKERQKFFQMAVTDSLTGLANVRYFMMILNTEYLLAKRESDERGFCIIMIDIDNFKKFNDTYGHAVGDFVLKGVAEVLKNSIRASDVVARYGGEEMVVLLRVTRMKSAMAVAEKIRRNVEEFDFKDMRNRYKVTISLGVSEFNAKEDNPDTVMRRADAGLYKAKESGRNRVETLETY
jgi:diguanylate cyclase